MAKYTNAEVVYGGVTAPVTATGADADKIYYAVKDYGELASLTDFDYVFFKWADGYAKFTRATVEPLGEKPSCDNLG